MGRNARSNSFNDFQFTRRITAIFYAKLDWCGLFEDKDEFILMNHFVWEEALPKLDRIWPDPQRKH